MLCGASSRGCAVTSNRGRPIALQGNCRNKMPKTALYFVYTRRFFRFWSRKDPTMDKLTECVYAFEKMLNIQYRVIIGRKGKATELCIGFSKLDFHHLVGLGKLKDLRIATRNRRIVFDEILTGKINYKTILKSRYLDLIENRFQPLAHIETLFDDNRLVFRYNPTQNQFSLIQADYLLSTPYSGNDVYIFLAKQEDTKQYFCRSFFPKQQKDYTKGQAVYTMLYKEKVFLTTGTAQIQFDRLTPRN